MLGYACICELPTTPGMAWTNLLTPLYLPRDIERCIQSRSIIFKHRHSKTMSTDPHVLGSITRQQFIQEYWQTTPLLMRGTELAQALSADADELAGLACEPEVESRLVLLDRDTETWHCEHGPFPESRFGSLPKADWTLLVQAVDQWLPDFAKLKDAFNFIPNWRLDDLMVSYATQGGGVGAHFDSYDVFLLQLSGARCWEIGSYCDETAALKPHPDLKLLETFEPEQVYQLEPGDMLYLPPGISHRGTATSDACMTCSIGFRAPVYRDVLQQAAALVADELSTEQRYRDPKNSLGTDPHLIPSAVSEGLELMWKTAAQNQLPGSLARAFGMQVTEPRYPDLIEPSDDTDVEAITNWLKTSDQLMLEHHPSSRFAYRRVGDSAELFVDGHFYETSVTFAQALCREHFEGLLTTDEREILIDLILRGSINPQLIS